MTTDYPARTWYDPRLRLGESATHGTGIFASAPVEPDEVVMVWGGTPYTVDDLRAGRVPRGISYSIVDDNLLLVAPADDMDYFINHSCDPNLWLGPGLALHARRGIEPGIELTIDYGTVESEPDYLLADCRCGSELCRGQVTGSDWQDPDLQDRYRGHFLPIIERQLP